MLRYEQPRIPATWNWSIHNSEEDQELVVGEIVPGSLHFILPSMETVHMKIQYPLIRQMPACMNSVWMFAVQSENYQELQKRLRKSLDDVHVVNRSMWKQLGLEMSFALSKTNTACLQCDSLKLKVKTIYYSPCNGCVTSLFSCVV